LAIDIDVGQPELDDVVAIHGACEFRRKCVVVIGNPTLDELAPTYDWVKNVHRYSGFWLGDLQLYADRFGEEASQILDETDLADKTLANARWVASQIPVSRRREGVSFSHHAEVASLEPAQQDEWLERAQVEDLSVHELRLRIKDAKSKADGHPLEFWVMVRCNDIAEQTALANKFRMEGREAKTTVKKT
jgi:hypothetical protein